MDPRPCRFFNLPSGCNKSADVCVRKHELYCTKPKCVESGKAHTHVLSQCGIPKPKNKPVAGEDLKRALCEVLFNKVTAVLKEDQTVEALKSYVCTPKPGKIVGMFMEGLDIRELTSLLKDDKLLAEKMFEALDILEAHAVIEKS